MSSDAPAAGDSQSADFDGTVQSSRTLAVPRFNSRPPPPQQQPNDINIPRITPLSSDPSPDTGAADGKEDPPHQRLPDASPKPSSDAGVPKITAGSQDRSPEELAEGLEGKYVDEFGNILDWDGTVLGRVEGDLPSMVGKPVSASGKILDDDGDVAGYVAENYAKPPLKPLAGNLKTDEEGNIYNGDGQVIGKLNSPPGQQDGEAPKDGQRSQPSEGAKSSATPSPSEVYLDVKSTHDGIQLIIKIPTVFKKGQDEHRN